MVSIIKTTWMYEELTSHCTVWPSIGVGGTSLCVMSRWHWKRELEAANMSHIATSGPAYKSSRNSPIRSHIPRCSLPLGIVRHDERPPLRPQPIRPSLLSRLKGNCFIRTSCFWRTENERTGLIVVYTQIEKATCRSYSPKAFSTPRRARRQAKIC